MPHPKELIAQIRKKLLRDYPASKHEYVVEQRLHGAPEKVYPDIQVLRGEALMCVVEIGYTRPEKLKLYKGLNIPDVRWYSKDGELANEMEIMPIKLEYQPHAAEMWRAAWVQSSAEPMLHCPDKSCEKDLIEEGVDFWDHQECYGWLWRCCDGKRGFLVFQCDLCGSNILAEGPDIADYLDGSSLMEYEEFLSEHYRQEREMKKEIVKHQGGVREVLIEEYNNYELSFSELKARLKVRMDFEVDYNKMALTW